MSWYDNEWGYSNKIIDLISYMSSIDTGVEIKANAIKANDLPLIIMGAAYKSNL